MDWTGECFAAAMVLAPGRGQSCGMSRTWDLAQEATAGGSFRCFERGAKQCCVPSPVFLFPLSPALRSEVLYSKD